MRLVRSAGPGALVAACTLLSAVVLAVAGCDRESSPEPDAPISRERFVEVMVELRDSARASGWEVEEEVRDRILERHGVGEEELVGFARARGDDPGTMQEIWEEVEDRLEERQEGRLPDPIDDKDPPAEEPAGG